MTALELLSMNATILCDALTIASLELFPANDTFIHQQMMKRHEFPLWAWQTLWFCRYPLGPAFWFGAPYFWTREGKTERESFWKTSRRTCWLKQRTANNFLTQTIHFHRQTSDTATDTELMAVESHTWHFLHMDVYLSHVLAVRWDRSWVCIILSGTLTSFGSKCRGMGKWIAPKGALSHCPPWPTTEQLGTTL